MDAVITRIIEIEKQSSLDIKRAEDAYRKNIEAHRRTLEEEKQKNHDQIISTENARLSRALQSLNQQSRETSLASGNDFENRFHDSDLMKAIKERIVAILLMQ